MANRFPLVVDTDDSNKIKELPLADNLDVSGGGITGATFISTQQLIVNGDTITPFSGSWNDLADKPNIPVDVSELTDTTNLLDHFSGSWNDLSDKPVLFSGSYTDLTNKPVVPTDVNQLGDVDNLLNTVTIIDWPDITSKPTTISGFGITDAYTQTQIGTLLDNKVDKNSAFYGDMYGSVLGADSSVIVDATNSAINASNISVSGSVFATGRFDGNIQGYVYGTDGTTILVDGNLNEIPQSILQKTSFVKAFGVIQANGGGTPTVSGGSYNISGVVRDSTGEYTVSFDNAVTSSNYVVQVTARSPVTATRVAALIYTTDSSSFVVRSFAGNGTLNDNISFGVTVIGL